MLISKRDELLQSEEYEADDMDRSAKTSKEGQILGSEQRNKERQVQELP